MASTIFDCHSNKIMPTHRRIGMMSYCGASGNIAEQEQCSGYHARPGKERGKCTFIRFTDLCDWTSVTFNNVCSEAKRCPKRVLTGEKSEKPQENAPKPVTVEELEQRKNFNWDD